MKKFLLILFALLSCVSLTAATDDPFLSLQLFNSKSLYYQSPTDVFNGASTLEIMMVQEGQPRFVRATPNDGTGVYEDLPIYSSSTKYAEETMYARLKTGLDVGFFRIGLFQKRAQLELAFSGALNSVFQGFGGADNLGFDGIFFFGPQLQLFDALTVRFGLKHYSGHYGDETINNYVSVNKESRTLIEYTRDNDLFLGVTVEPIENLHLKFEASRPRLNTWMNPSVHIPSWVLKPSNGLSLNEVRAEEENVDPSIYPDSYKAWIVQTGLSYELPLTKQLGLIVSGNYKLHQDGQTKHQVGMYDENNSWEQEYTISTGFTFMDTQSNHRALFLVTYHDGRFPLLNYFYQRTSYLSVSVQIG